MKCKHCFYNESFKEDRSINENSLTFDELKKMSESINKILYLSLAGGEPFIRDDLEEIIKLFTKNKKVFRYQIPTSGFKTSMIVEKTQKILQNNPSIPFRVHVSLDGNEAVHKLIRGVKDSYKNALETIMELNKLKRSYSYFDVGIVTTICSYNQDIVDELGEIVESVHPNGEWCINIVRGESRSPDAMKLDLRNYYKAHEVIDRRIRAGTYKGYTGHVTSSWLSAKNAARRKIIFKILSNNYKGGGCSAGSLGGVIYPDGSVYACEMLNEQIGNLRYYDFDLSRLWNSEHAVRIRNHIQNSNCLCTHECSLSTNFLIQSKPILAGAASRKKLPPFWRRELLTSSPAKRERKGPVAKQRGGEGNEVEVPSSIPCHFVTRAPFFSRFTGEDVMAFASS